MEKKRHSRSWGNYLSQYERLKTSRGWDASQDAFEVMQICTNETKIATGSTDPTVKFQDLYLGL